MDSDLSGGHSALSTFWTTYARKASGYDDITRKITRLEASGIADSLTKLYNESIQIGENGEGNLWKPVYKKEDQCHKNYYRPITLLPIVVLRCMNDCRIHE